MPVKIILNQPVKFLSLLIFIWAAASGSAQNKMRTVEELIHVKDPGWPFILQMIDSAVNKIEVIPADSTKAKDALFKRRLPPGRRWAR